MQVEGVFDMAITSKCRFLLEKAMVTHSSTLGWKIPWTEEPGRLQSMGSLGIGHDWATSLSLLCTAEGNGSPFQCSCLENPRDGGAWWAAVYRVALSRTWLTWLSSSSSSRFLHKRNFMVKLSLSYIVLEFVEERILESETHFEAVQGSAFETLPTRFLASLINRNWSEARQDIQARLYWSPCCSRVKWEQTACSLLACFPKWR